MQPFGTTGGYGRTASRARVSSGATVVIMSIGVRASPGPAAPVRRTHGISITSSGDRPAAHSATSAMNRGSSRRLATSASPRSVSLRAGSSSTVRATAAIAASRSPCSAYEHARL